MTHDQLVISAANWLRRGFPMEFPSHSNRVFKRRHQYVVTELVTACSETPDVLGWRYGQSTLIECKTSRADFLRDKNKWFRRRPVDGLGQYRYFCTPPGLLSDADLPERWGLIEIAPKSKTVIKHAVEQTAWNHTGECQILLSVIRRSNTPPPRLTGE